jgi:hypothetical protein
MDSLRNRGEGINHIGFEVDDVDSEVARLVGTGLRLVYSAKFKPIGGMAYFESEIGDGYYLEVVQWPPE